MVAARRLRSLPLRSDTRDWAPPVDYVVAMAAMLLVTYNVSDPEGFAGYNPGSLPVIGATVKKHGGSITFAGKPEVVRGEGTQASVGITFPDAAAAKAWLDDPDYAEAKAIRIATTDTITESIVELG